MPFPKGQKHTAEAKVKMSLARKGIPKTPEHLAKLSIALKGTMKAGLARHRALDLPNCRCYSHGAARPYMVSSYTWMLCDVLVALGFELVIPEAQFGLYRVDALLAEEWIAFEADGNYHFTKERHTYDLQRDIKLLDRFGLPVVRFSGAEVKQLWKAVCDNA